VRFSDRRSVLEPGEIDPTEVGQEVSGGIVLRQGDLLLVRIEDLGVETEAPQFLDEDLEGLGDARRLDLLALDDGFVGLDAPEDVVRLDGEQLLQDVRGPVGLERWPPNCALPPSGCWVIRLYGPVDRAWILSSTRWWSLSM
jgi:hypothetical protein